MGSFWVFDQNDGGNLPPGAPPTQKFEGPWFTTQLTISASIGLTSFFLFSYCRTRWPLLFAPRTKLKGFSPHEAHAHNAFFGWIMPTIRTSEFTVLQIVGLDAAVLLNFFKMSFYLFSVCSLFAIAILMPINWKHNKDLDDDSDWPGNDTDWPALTRMPIRLFDLPTGNRTTPSQDWLDLISDANSYLSVHLLFTYLFTLLSLFFIQKTYRRFIRSRQLFSLELVHSIPARTVLVTNLPNKLQGERTLAEYFENMGLSVESVTVCREVGSLKVLLDRRTKALLELERAWVDYVGNPSSLEEYDPEDSALPLLVDTDVEGGRHSSQQGRLVIPHRKRPTMRPGWFTPKVDALEYLEAQFKSADELVKKRRQTGKFKATQSAFVTFEKMSSAQIALQTAHSPMPHHLSTSFAPEPRDIVWSNLSPSPFALRVRSLLVLVLMALLFFFWLFPIAGLASLLSYKEIKKALPWLGRIIDQNDKLRAIVQNSLPSMAMITLNALLPFILEALTYVQGYRARSWVEYSLLKKYFLFLLVNVVFIFLLATTYWQLVRDLANSPAKVPEKLAQSLQAGRARSGYHAAPTIEFRVILPRFFYRAFLTRTPRDFAELNAPPMINYGVVYPQAILMFVITMLYSVVQPLIVIFGAIYFGVGYVVYKYKLLFVFYKPYESQGQAWPITFIRLIWGVVIFLLFMTGIFTLRKSYILSSLLVPLLLGTVLWSWWVDRSFRPLSKFVSLSSVFEVQRGEETADVSRLRAGHPVTWSQSNLNRRRYAQNDDTLYVAPEDERTDYSQPPMANWYSGVLNTGKKRYGHPALTGVLPEPWLPLKKGQTLVNHDRARASKDPAAVVLTLRKRYASIGRRAAGTGGSRARLYEEGDEEHEFDEDSRVRPPPSHRLSFDHASGVIMLPDDGGWLASDSESEEDAAAGPMSASGTLSQLDLDLGSGHMEGGEEVTTPTGRSMPLPETPTGASGSASTATTRSPWASRYGTYFHHPERRRQQSQQIPGAFPVGGGAPGSASGSGSGFGR
ncbi:hypothetical protein BD779DRAFT_1804233 [Infundibulicybe gibba]|nr:hypothetical protein BD779DRAFT_1804233 [Infundibulicybe gibba]